MKHTDIIGKKFGSLVVIEEIKNTVIVKGKSKSFLMVKCKCDCGNETTVLKGCVVGGNTKSCGCLRRINLSTISKKYHRLNYGVGSMRYLYSQYVYGARKRNIIWDLSEEDFIKTTRLNCFYCGSPPSQSVIGNRTRRNNGDYIYNGIDRVDNTKGYLRDNIVPCCGICNKIKMAMSICEFFEWVKKVYFHLNSINFQLPTGISLRKDFLCPSKEIFPPDIILEQHMSEQ